MKTIFYLLSLMCTLPLAAQKKVEKMFPYTNGKEIYLNLKYASDIHIKTWDKNEIGITASVNINNNANNDNFVLESSTTKDSQIEIKGNIKDLKLISTVPTNVQSDSRGNYYGDNRFWDDENKVYISSGPQVFIIIDYDIYIPEQAALLVKTISGNVLVDYLKGKYRLETISGKIDLKTAATTKCDFSLHTITGDVYTNLALESPQAKNGELSRVGGQYDRDLKLNNGGEKLVLKTISGNIYLRKK
ncbi:hypothetical protein QNI19_10705 [Cytophagaceae bacterium DM2B3-1]|uniref:Adhesin domain-containing protein n=1 Tax=Xanthocytophaga flava TaxID=3048013 RepID=A0ABT7CIP0_9BACT|nr:hypothetical protein [Xanthocytophaga flavus]MDJ1493401.1 hypothetical protein [Xanthocytophaga flavus]